MAVVSQLKRKASVRAAAAEGRPELLVALRDKIADEIDSGEVHPRDLAALSRRLVDIAEQLEALEEATDEIAVAAAIPDEAWSAQRG